MKPDLIIVAGLAFVSVFNALVVLTGLRSRRIPYGWFFFVPLMASREGNPVVYWAMVVLCGAIAVYAAAWALNEAVWAIGFSGLFPSVVSGAAFRPAST